MVDPAKKEARSRNVSYKVPGNRSTSRGTLNSYKRLPFMNKDAKSKDSSYSAEGSKRPEKRHNLYLGTKIQTAWETRTININPVTSEDLSRFLGNEQHTQRWSIISQMFYILLYNLRRLPFLWSIFIFLCEVLVPMALPSGIPNRAWYSSAIPLFVSLFLSIFVNLLEFKKRYNLGRFIDNKRCILLKDGKLSSVRSGSVAVGNILKLNCDDQVPADSVVLYSSNLDGALYLDTCYLDGQTDLKTKYSVKDSKMESSLRSYHNLKGNIVCEKPSPDMNSFSGLLKIKGYPRPSVISVDNFIMRGSILRNTGYIYVVVVYTGPDTKASQNYLRILKPIKIGCLEKTINKISVILGLIYLACTIASITFRYVGVHRGIGRFNKNVASPIDSIPFIIFRFVVLYAQIIPTTLPAIMDLLRLLYLPFYDSYLNQSGEDSKLKRAPTISSSASISGTKEQADNGTWTLNSGLCEELGLVDFIFTDKTGTLTTNNLSITLVTILGRSYTPKQLIEKYQPSIIPATSSIRLSSSSIGSSSAVVTAPVTTVDEEDEEDEQKTRLEADAREHFMRLLVICNPCLNTDTIESTNTMSSSYNTNYSRASSFKLSTRRLRSYNITNTSFNLSSGEGPMEGGPDAPMEGGPEEGEEEVKVQIDIGDVDQEGQDENDILTELRGSHQEDGGSKTDEDESNLPLYKKTKSKAHFGTITYLNLHESQTSNETFELSTYEDEPSQIEEKQHLNCTSKEDECMVNLASESGYMVVNRNKDHITVNCNGDLVNYEVLGINEFTSSRKRMSVVVNNTTENETYLYVKGEAHSMISCLREENVKTTVSSRLRKNSMFGYRVIICGYKVLTSTELLTYESKVNAANTHSYNQASAEGGLSEDYLEELEDKIDYLGIVMFRDEIQRDISSSIDLLMDAGIRIWVLTGDNKEATIQTCYLAKLLNVPTHLFMLHLTPSSVDRLEDLRKGNRFIAEDGTPREEDDDKYEYIYNKFLIERSSGKTEQLCLVLEGPDLDQIMQSVKGQNILVNMACTADVVLGCLLTPVQKGRLVQLVRTKLAPTPITLAIGDGVNDVQMLQHSHISVCLQPTSTNSASDEAAPTPAPSSTSRKDSNTSSSSANSLIAGITKERDGEGEEEVVVKDEKKVTSNDIIGYCDFCVDNFSNLTNLLFLQGTRILRAMSLVIYFTIFKSLLLILPLFYYQLFTNWVGLDFYGSFITIIFNLVFTLLPLLGIVLFYQDVEGDLYRKLPVLYTLSRRRIYLNLTNSLFWIGEGIVCSLISYVPLHVLIVTNNNVFLGEVISNRTFGLIISAASIIIFNTRLLINYTPNNILFNILSGFYFFASVPMYLGLDYLAGKRSLGISSYQIARVAPFYFLVPVWITFTLLVSIGSNVLHMKLVPNLTRYLKSYTKSTNTNKQDLRSVFSIYGSAIVKKMIPTSRPFKIKKGAHVVINKNKEEDENNINRLINIYTLRFKDVQLESDYRIDKNKKQYYENGHWYKIVFILLFIFYLAGFLIEYFVQKSWHRAPAIYSMIPTILLEVVLVVCIIVSFNRKLFIRFINHILYSLVTFMILQHLANRFLLKSISWLHPVLFPIFTFVILRISFVLSLITNIIFFIGTIVAVSNNIHVIPLFIGINIFVGFVGYGLEYKSRSNFIMEFSVVDYRKKQSELLNTMLPRSVVSKMINAKLNENGIPIGFEAESHENVSVIFADVYNFQNLVASIEPHKLVEILDNLFLSFDRCSKEFGATKIETVSESYLTSLGLSHGNKTEGKTVSTGESEEEEGDVGAAAASKAIDMSIAMLQVSSTIRINNLEPIGIKIGINSGYVISGLVGAKKPQYALFGDTVNTASRMKMTGVMGKIHISESTHELVAWDKTLEFTPRQIEVKGKGVMNTYLLEKALGTSYPNFMAGNMVHEVDIYFDLLKNQERLNSMKSSAFAAVTTPGPSEDLMQSDEMGSEVSDLASDEMKRIKSRKDNINRAVGNEEDDINSLSYSPLYTRNYEGSTFDSFPEAQGTKCYWKCRPCGNKRRFSAYSRRFASGSKRFSISSTRRFSITTGRFSGNKRFSSSSSTASNEYSTLSRRFTTRTGSIRHSRNRLSRTTTITHLAQREKEEDFDGIHMKKIESILLKFRDKLQEDRYRSNFYNSTGNVAVNESALFIFLVTFIVQSIINVNVPRIYNKDNTKLIVYLDYIVYWTVRCFFIMMSFFLWLLFHYRFFTPSISNNDDDNNNRNSAKAAESRVHNLEDDFDGDKNEDKKVIKIYTFFLNLLFVSASCVFALSNSWSIKRTAEVDGNLWLTSDSIEFYFYLILLHHSTGMLFQNCLLIDSLFLVLSMTFISSSVQRTATTVTALFTIPICVLFNLLSAHCKESIDRKTFFTNEKAYMIETRINQILNEMLPKSILEEFKQEKLKMSYVHNNMSFLFSDICGFTSWANSVDPSEVIALLQKLFANFDRNSTNFNLYKLCTIGDAYVAISEPYLTNTNDMRLNDLLNILQMAYSMLHIIQETRELFNIPNLNMRIGLHYGSCIGGVIGSGRLRYDVWGTDIYTANMIESNGIPGKVCVSEPVKELLSSNFSNRFTFKFNKEVQVVDKLLKSYLIEYDSLETV